MCVCVDRDETAMGRVRHPSPLVESVSSGGAPAGSKSLHLASSKFNVGQSENVFSYIITIIGNY